MKDMKFLEMSRLIEEALVVLDDEERGSAYVKLFGETVASIQGHEQLGGGRLNVYVVGGVTGCLYDPNRRRGLRVASTVTKIGAKFVIASIIAERIMGQSS